MKYIYKLARISKSNNENCFVNWETKRLMNVTKAKRNYLKSRLDKNKKNPRQRRSLGAAKE